MTYATGSASSCSDLLNQFQTFAVGQGWTIDKFVLGTGSNPLLFMHKGICFATMQGLTTNQNDWTTGSAVSFVEGQLNITINSSINTALNTWNGHPGGQISGAQQCINDMLGPFTNYWFFTDPTVSDYIHVVLQTSGVRYQHFSIGHIDKGGFTHGGVAYSTGINRYWWKYLGGASPWTASTYNRNNPSIQQFPYVTSGSPSFSPFTSIQLTYYAPDALPNDGNWSLFSNGHVSGIDPHNQPSDWTGSFQQSLPCSAVIASPILDWSGQLPMLSIPLIAFSLTSGFRSCYLGDIPNIRMVNLTGLTAGQEISISSDIWKVFPVGQQNPWGSQTQVGDIFTTGQYGFAFKKVA